jgi:hypothetical protein
VNAYEHKTTRERRRQEFSPGDDWELIASPTWVDWAWAFAGCVALVCFLIWANG